jgi:8-oxo-dGTP pyrophosphatase MutT (NUDIX family)
MNFPQKIYYNDKPLILTTDAEDYIKNNPVAGTYIKCKGISSARFTEVAQQLERQGVKGAIIEEASEEAIGDQLYSQYHYIEAAGGIAYNEDGDILMIFRRGKWDLPKGKLDEGEQIEDCAIREVSEETGLQQLALSTKICDTYHVYSQYGENWLKHTAWYKMKASSTEVLKPQKEENILEARWVDTKELAPLVARTYEAIKDVLHAAELHW